MEGQGPLVPDVVEMVDFSGDTLMVALVEGKAFVALQPVAQFLGLDWSAQYQRVMRDEVLSHSLATLVMTRRDERRREMTALQLECLLAV